MERRRAEWVASSHYLDEDAVKEFFTAVNLARNKALYGKKSPEPYRLPERPWLFPLQQMPSEPWCIGNWPA